MGSVESDVAGSALPFCLDKGDRVTTEDAKQFYLSVRKYQDRVSHVTVPRTKKGQALGKAIKKNLGIRCRYGRRGTTVPVMWAK